MHFTTLNKLIRLFLIGSFGFLLAVAISEQFRDFLNDVLNTQPSESAVVLSLVFFSTAIVLGALVEGLADATTRPWLEGALQSRWRAALFLKGAEFDQINTWKSGIRSLSVDSDFDALFEKYPKSLTSSILHKYALPNHVTFVDTHYSMFMMASSFVALVGLVIPTSLVYVLIGQITLGQFGVSLFLALAGLFVLCIFALDNLLYSWLAIYRHAWLWLWERQEAQGSQEETQHTGENAA